jgi:hypothetical protein
MFVVTNCNAAIEHISAAWLILFWAWLPHCSECTLLSPYGAKRISLHNVEWQQLHFGYKAQLPVPALKKFKFMVSESFEVSCCSCCEVAFAAPA